MRMKKKTFSKNVYRNKYEGLKEEKGVKKASCIYSMSRTQRAVGSANSGRNSMKIISTVITKPYNHKLEKREGGLEINLDIHVPTHAHDCIVRQYYKSYWQIQIQSFL